MRLYPLHGKDDETRQQKNAILSGDVKAADQTRPVETLSDTKAQTRKTIPDPLPLTVTQLTRTSPATSQHSRKQKSPIARQHKAGFRLA